MSLDGISGWNYNGYLWELDPKKTTTTNSAFNAQRPVIPQAGFQSTPAGNIWVQPQPTPTPTAAPVPNPAPKQLPTSGIYPTADGAKYARMLENNPLPQQATTNTGAAATTAKKPYVAPSIKPASQEVIDQLKAEIQQPVEQPAADEAKAETKAEAKKQRVKTPEQRAAQLKRIRSNPEARARYKRLKLKNNPELAKRYESYCKTVKKNGGLKKLGGMKGLKKAGKWGALAALVIGGGTLLYKACSNDKKDDTVKQEPETPKPSTPVENKPTEPAAPAPAEEEPAAPVDGSSNTGEIGAGEFKDGKYKVKKGDCFWIIAEKNLIEEYKKAQKAKNEAIDENYKPTDAEIMKETERLVEKNGYEYDEKHWNTTKPIYEGDILNIAA